MSDNTDWKMTAEAAEETIRRVWKALGIATYEQAGGKAINEIVEDRCAALKNIAKQKTTEELQAEGDQEYEDADFEGGYDAIIHIARRVIAPKP